MKILLDGGVQNAVTSMLKSKSYVQGFREFCGNFSPKSPFPMPMLILHLTYHS